jgi:hypothetical protein
LRLKVSRGSGSVANPRREARFRAWKDGEKCPLVGRQRKKSRFFKIFSKNPKVLRFAADNTYMNAGNRSWQRWKYFKYFLKKP